MNPDDPAGSGYDRPTRPMRAHRQAPGPGGHRLTAEQLTLADDLYARALALRAASEDGLSIREAVDLAAFMAAADQPRGPEGDG
jgi:hypothetical protein